MCNQLTVQQTAQLLLERDRILILSHQSPDGDTIGSGYALCRALHQLGKRAAVLCADAIPWRMTFVASGMKEALWLTPEQAEYVVAVDIADVKLMGSALSQYQQPGAVDLCIDHHPSNTRYARNLLLCPKEAAACQILYDVITAMGVSIDQKIAQCLYLGIATDTGCFRYSNTQSRSHEIVSKLMETGFDWYSINYRMFELKTKAQMDLERRALQTLHFCCDGKAAMIAVTQEMLSQSGATMDDVEGITATARNLEGVEIGATLKERPEGGFKISVRTSESVDASAICAVFGGGGHIRASGCLIREPLEKAIRLLEERFAAALAGTLPVFTD